MKAENTDKLPKFNLLQPDGTRQQANAENITKVLLNDGVWYDILAGSFKFYKTSDKGVPFVQFKTKMTDVNGGFYEKVTPHVVEVFPASVCGLAYLPENEDENE